MIRGVSFGKQALVSLVIILLAAGLWSARGAISSALGVSPDQTTEVAKSQRPAIRVVTANVALADDDLYLEALGTGRAQRSVSLRGESEGKIVEMALAAGARFAAGEVLLRLDDVDERLEVALAEARLEQADRSLGRAEQLEDRGFTAQANLDNARTAARIARLELERARQTLKDRSLRAPFDGVASIPEVEVGDWIDSDDVVATFDDRSVLLIEFEAPELLLPRIRLEMPVAVVNPAAPGLEITGAVAAIDSRVDAVSRSARIRIAAPNPDDRLRPGASFEVRLNLEGARYPSVPELALQFSREGLYVWRAVDGKADRVAVRLIRRRTEGVLVEGDLNAGDLVVVEGAKRLTQGRALQAVADPAARR
ncbi:MAG: efflux RND transporter periplasmic adaptor subunit [Neomegalonema sp.]